MNLYFFPLAVALALCASVCVAATETDDLPPDLVVTATRVPTPENQVASSITVITAGDISARQIRTLPDLLKDVPGLNVVRSGGPGGQTSLFMRGTNSNHTKVLIDGIDVSDPSNGNASFDVGQLLAQDIERVEILRGPQSGLYGSDAIGGVINIITQSGSGPTKFNASAEAGSFESFNQTAALHGSLERLSFAANVQHFHSGATPVTPSDYLAPGQRRIDDAYDNLTGSTKLGFAVNDHLDLGLVARHTDAHLRYTGDDFNFFPTIANSAQSESGRKQYYTRASLHAVSFDGVVEQTLGAAYDNVKSRELGAGGAPETDNFGARVKFDWQGIIALAAGEKLILGAEHQRDEITTPFSADTSINSGYAELQSNPVGSLYDTLAVRYDDNTRFGSKVTYRLAPVYSLASSGTKIKASVGTAFKAPTLSEMFQNFPAFGFFANPNLRPESSLGWDVGFEQAALRNRVRFGVTYFRNDLKNLIANNAEFTTFVNIGRASTRGVESFLTLEPMENLTLRLDHTYTQATDQIRRLTLLRRPKNKESLTAAWAANPRWSLNATLLTVSSWVDGNRDFSIQRLNASPYTTVDLATNFSLDSHWALFGRVSNVFNRHYQNPNGFDQPTIGVFAGSRRIFSVT